MPAAHSAPLSQANRAPARLFLFAKTKDKRDADGPTLPTEGHWGGGDRQLTPGNPAPPLWGSTPGAPPATLEPSKALWEAA